MASLATPIAATSVSLAGLPLAGISAATAVGSVLKGVSPSSRLHKWSQRVADISAKVAENHQYIPAMAVRQFLILMDKYMTLKIEYEKDIQGGFRAWYGTGRMHGNQFRDSARVIFRQGLTLSTMATAKRQYCELHHKNPPKNSRGQCILCFPESISTASPMDENDPQNPLLTWPAFLRSRVAQEALEQDPPTYSDAVDDDPTIDALQSLPEEEISDMVQEYCDYALRDNDIQPTEYNPWASLANLRSSRGSVPES